MSPQPASPAKRQPAAATPEAPAADATPTPVAEDTPASRQIARANQLERDRTALMEKVGKNREYLRLMQDNEELTAEQAAWVAAFYPEKEKGERRSEDEVEVTRRVKAAARGGATSHVIPPATAATSNGNDKSTEDDD